ncbi:MAG: glutamate racemase [Patescibacteria group bacterium]|jgi:glutamate racemase
MNPKGSIGIFDSGLGGLAILKEIVKLLPQYDYIYLGDNARVPYGSRSPELIYSFTQKAVDYLFSQNCQLVVLACNTVTAVALPKIQKEYLPKHYPTRRVLGVIQPTLEAVTSNGHKRIGLIGTRATVASQGFIKKVKELSPDVEMFQNASPLLVPYIEEGNRNGQILDLILDEYLKPLLKQRIDSLILGCTHYGLVAGKVAKRAGKNVTVISEGPIVAEKLADYLKRHPEIDKKLGKNGKRKYFVTDLPERYTDMARMFLGEMFGKKDELELVGL